MNQAASAERVFHCTGGSHARIDSLHVVVYLCMLLRVSLLVTCSQTVPARPLQQILPVLYYNPTYGIERFWKLKRYSLGKMGDFLGSYVTTDEDEVISRQIALLRAEQPVSIMEMDELQNEKDCIQRLRELDELDSMRGPANRVSEFEAENWEELNDIGVEPMSLFAPKSIENVEDEKLFSVQLYTLKNGFERKEQKSKAEQIPREQKKAGIKNSLIRLLWKKSGNQKEKK